MTIAGDMIPHKIQSIDSDAETITFTPATKYAVASAAVVTIDGATKYVTFSDIIILTPRAKPGAGTEVDGMIYKGTGADNHFWGWNGTAWVQLDN